MTRIATLGGLDVSSDLGSRRYNATVCVTVLALTQGASEIAAPVAVTATCNQVRAVQAEAGRIVVKIGANSGLRRRRS
jgi:hypothetical protein